MKKLIFAFLLTVSSLMAEQKFVYFTARVRDYDVLQESKEINSLMKKGWEIKNIQLSACGSNSSLTQIAVLLERTN